MEDEVRGVRVLCWWAWLLMDWRVVSTWHSVKEYEHKQTSSEAFPPLPIAFSNLWLRASDSKAVSTSLHFLVLVGLPNVLSTEKAVLKLTQRQMADSHRLGFSSFFFFFNLDTVLLAAFMLCFLKQEQDWHFLQKGVARLQHPDHEKWLVWGMVWFCSARLLLQGGSCSLMQRNWCSQARELVQKCCLLHFLGYITSTSLWLVHGKLYLNLFVVLSLLIFCYVHFIKAVLVKVNTVCLTGLAILQTIFLTKK